MYTTHKCDFCSLPVVRREQAKSKNVKTHFCNLICKGEFQKLSKPVTKEWLYEHYVLNGLDTSQIGIIVNRDPKSVWNWLKDFDIPTRPRGGFTSPNAFQKGSVNLFLGRTHSEETKAKLSAIAKADGRVPFDPKVGSYMKGRKGPDSTNWKGGVTPDRQSLYSSQEWIDAVKSVWARDGAICQKCGKNHNEEKNRGTFHIHHVTSFSVKKLRSDPENLVLLCKSCHLWVHSKKNINKQFIKGI